jgi:coenzyme F420-reducing hydrogenase beta subunit
MATDKTKKYRAFKMCQEAKIEHWFLKGHKDADLGVYCNMFSAKTVFEGQDGGVVTALLVKGFKKGLFDSAIVVHHKGGYKAEAKVAKSAEEAIAAKGTKYLRVDVTAKLRELVDQGKKRIAIVCTPCETKKVRKIQQTLPINCQITVIGLFCFRAFNKAKLKEEISKRFKVNLDEAEETRVHHGKFILHVDGKEHICQLKDLDSAMDNVCAYCEDFTAQFADISVGSTGSREGFSTVIVRSKVGEDLIEKLNACIEAVDKASVAKLVKSKRERAEKASTS